jgi:ribosome maturation protein Sdo1
MDADGLDFDYVGVTSAAVHRIEAAPMLARIRADMTVQAFCQAMNCLRKLRRIHFVAVETGIRVLGIRCLYSERQAGEEEGEACD